jgi:3-oxoacid CoA-transferase A subunit
MTAAEAVALIPEHASILMGGFGLCGIPENLIKALAKQGTGNLTVMSNNAGVDNYGIGLLLQNRQVHKMIGTYVGENDLLESMILQKQIEIELIPQGTFAERVRAHGAGIPAFFTPTGVGTVVADRSAPTSPSSKRTRQTGSGTSSTAARRATSIR